MIATQNTPAPAKPFAPLYGPRSIPVWTQAMLETAKKSGALGRHSYCQGMFINDIDQVDLKYAEKNALTLYGMAAFNGRIIITLSSNPDRDGGGEFISISMTAEELAAAGLVVGDTVTAVYERHELPGYGQHVALARTPGV